MNAILLDLHALLSVVTATIEQGKVAKMATILILTDVQRPAKLNRDGHALIVVLEAVIPAQPYAEMVSNVDPKHVMTQTNPA